MARVKPVVVRTADQLANALDLTPAEVHEWDFRIQLTRRIVKEMESRQLTHSEVARLAGTSRTRVTAIVNGGLVDISSDLLLRILGSLGIRVKATFLKAA